MSFCVAKVYLHCSFARVPTLVVTSRTLDGTSFLNWCLLTLAYLEMRWPMCWHHLLTMTKIPQSSGAASRRLRDDQGDDPPHRYIRGFVLMNLAPKFLLFLQMCVLHLRLFSSAVWTYFRSVICIWFSPPPHVMCLYHEHP